MTVTISPRPSGGTTTRTNALTGKQLNLVLRAAHRALSANGDTISPSRVNRIVRRFSKALARADVTFHEFLTDEANRKLVVMIDPELAPILPFWRDPVGEKATNNVMRERARRGES